MQGVAYQIHGSFAQRANTPDEAKAPIQLLGMNLERLLSRTEVGDALECALADMQTYAG